MRNIIFLGLVSFFADMSTEMVYPLIPLYLTMAFGATPALVGVIEGIAESVASLLKVFSGYIGDKYHRKKPIAFLGYAAGLVYKILLIFASSWGGVLVGRVTDRIGKGIRTAPRDVLVSESGGTKTLGRSFGIHKTLDMAGSAVGILIAFFIFRSWNGNDGYNELFLFSCIPAVLSLGMFFFIRETAAPAAAGAKRPVFGELRRLDSRLKLYLLVVFLFTLGNSSNAFLLLRAKNVGFSASSVILLYFVYNLVSSLLALPLGRLSDRIGRKRVLVSGYAVFAVVYAAFAWAAGMAMVAAAFVLYGVFTAATAGVERAFIAEIAPPAMKGTVLGLESTLVGVALFPASLIAGVLWDAFGPMAPFAFGASLSFIAALVLAFGLPSAVPGQEKAQ